MTTETFAHPETGEVLESQDDFHKALDEVNERMVPLWNVRRALREAYAGRYEPVLPTHRRNRTDKQERIARCPRCGAPGDILDTGGKP